MSSLQWIYDKHLKNFDEREDLTFDLLHQTMLIAKWEFSDTLSKEEAFMFQPDNSRRKEDFYREVLEINGDILASCGLTFQEFYEKSCKKQIHSLQGLYDKHIKPLEGRDDVTFDLVFRGMLTAKWEFFDGLTSEEEIAFKPDFGKTKEDFCRKVLHINDDILTSCGLTFEQFYEKCCETRISSLQWIYEKHIKPLEEIKELTFDIVHQSMLKAKWEFFDTLSKEEAVAFQPDNSRTKEDFYREVLEINGDILASCGLTFREFYEKVGKALFNMPVGGGILIDPTCQKIILIKCKISGKYDFPKGKIEPGECVRDAALRNIKVRTGFSAILDELNPITAMHKNRAFTLYFSRNVPIDFEFSPRYDKIVSHPEFFDLNKIRNNGWYGRTGKRVTLLVTRFLEDIKTYCWSMQVQERWLAKMNHYHGASVPI